MNIDILIVGGGIAGFSSAIKAKTLSPEKNIVVIDKAERPGALNISGGVFNPKLLDLIIDNYHNDNSEYITKLLEAKVNSDNIGLLTPNHKLSIPRFLTPSGMKHTGDHITSSGDLVKYLHNKAIDLGVEVYYRFAIETLLIRDNEVIGVIIKGTENTEEIFSKVTIISDGSLGNVSRELISRFKLNNSFNPQIYSLGLKEILMTKKPHNLNNTIFHFLGYPNKIDQFGGAFLYGLSKNKIAIGLILGLDWTYKDINPQQELERFKNHPFIKKSLGEFDIISCGANTIPEGGFYSLPLPGVKGAILTGDSGGFVNVAKLKGIHLAIKSGVASGIAAIENITNNNDLVNTYKSELTRLGVYRELKKDSNFRGLFNTPMGYLLGAPLTFIKTILPKRIKVKEDRIHLPIKVRKWEYKSPFTREDFTSNAGISHNEINESHISFFDYNLCKKCIEQYSAPCLNFCPGMVYSLVENKISISHSNCLHDCSCIVKCPYNNINWTTPLGGQGPRYNKL